jgi:hypothetical protein
MTNSHCVVRKLIFCIDETEGTSMPWSDQSDKSTYVKRRIPYRVAWDITVVDGAIMENQINRPGNKTLGCSDLEELSECVE